MAIAKLIYNTIVTILLLRNMFFLDLNVLYFDINRLTDPKCLFSMKYILVMQKEGFDAEMIRSHTVSLHHIPLIRL